MTARERIDTVPIDDALLRARKFIAVVRGVDDRAATAVTARDPKEATIWGSPAGKKRLAARLTKLIPPHRVYVEPFAGSAAVFFEKEPAETEVLGDADPEIAAAFKAIKTLTDAELELLRKKDWVGRRELFMRLKEAKPRNKVEKLYQFLYLSHFAYGKLRGKSYNPNAEGIEARTIDRIEKFRDRLRPTTIRHANYAELVKEFDGKETFFFLDPPYPGYDVNVGEADFDEIEFRKVLDGIKGRFLVTYGTRGKLDTKGFQVRKIRPPRTIGSMRGVGGPKMLSQLLIANYSIAEKALGADDEEWTLEELDGVLDVHESLGDDLDRAKILARALSDGPAVPKELVTLARELGRLESSGDASRSDVARELVELGTSIAPALAELSPAIAAALVHASEPLLAMIKAQRLASEDIEKARLIPFQQWGGSAKYARRLAERLPEHKRYVEPFCGAAAVYFAKPAASEEVLADADPEVISALKYIQKLDARSLSALKRFSWRVSRAGFERAKAAKPASDAERFWKHVYGRLCTWGAKPNMSGYATIHDGQTYDLDDLWPFHERLQGARLVKQDWATTLSESDSPETLFFLDPPYAGEWALDDGIPPEQIASAASKLKGQFVIAYTDSAEARKALGAIGRAFKMRISEGRGAGQWQKRSRLFVASFKVQKHDEIELLDPDIDKDALIGAALQKRIRLLKTDEERYVLGIVLEPERVDAQQDIYSAIEVRDAAHRFMGDYRNLGLMHREILGAELKILESYLAPTDFKLDDTQIRKGTWLLAIRVIDDELWRKIKTGELSGYSMGGSALRKPE